MSITVNESINNIKMGTTKIYEIVHIRSRTKGEMGEEFYVQR